MFRLRLFGLLAARTALVCFLFAVVRHAAAAPLSSWVGAANEFASRERVELSLPSLSRLSELPINVSRGGEATDWRVGAGWALNIPHVSLDRAKMLRSGTGASFYVSSAHGRLVEADGFLIPQSQANTSSHKYRIVTAGDGRIQLALQSSERPREVWYFGSRAASRLTGPEGTAVWYLDRIENVEGDSVNLRYREIPGEAPLLESLSTSPDPFEIMFSYKALRNPTGEDFRHGFAVKNSHVLQTVSVLSRATGEDLFRTRFEFKESTWLGASSLLLARAIREELAPGEKVSAFSTEFCAPGHCLTSGPVPTVLNVSVGGGIDAVLALKEGRARFAQIDGTGLPSLVAIDGSRLMKVASTLGWTDEGATTLDFEGRNRLNAGQPPDGLLRGAAIWDFTDFNEDGLDDLWWVTDTNGSTGLSQINILLADAAGKFYESDRNHVSRHTLQVAIGRRQDVRIARISGDKTFSIVNVYRGTREVEIIKWDLGKKAFTSTRMPYSKVFLGDKVPEESISSGFTRFADLNNDGFDDWIELPVGSGFSTALTFHPGLGDGRFAPARSCPLARDFIGSTDIEFLDVNADGFNDLVDFGGGRTLSLKTMYNDFGGGGCFTGAGGTISSVTIDPGAPLGLKQAHDPLIYHTLPG